MTDQAKDVLDKLDELALNARSLAFALYGLGAQVAVPQAELNTLLARARAELIPKERVQRALYWIATQHTGWTVVRKAVRDAGIDDAILAELEKANG